MTRPAHGLPVGEIAPAHRFDVVALGRYLRERIEDFGEGLEVHQVQGSPALPDLDPKGVQRARSGNPAKFVQEVWTKIF